MEIICEICNKNYKPRRKEQKYCSVACQHKSYKKLKVERINISCQFCNKEFEILPNKMVKNTKKYCCRLCKDNHQKELYLGEKNPRFGKPHTDEWKRYMSNKTKELWKTSDIRVKLKNGVNNFFIQHGYYPGTDKESVEKRKKTMINKYGIYHNWVGKFGERKCDITTYNLYGKTSVDFLVDYQHFYGKKTDIEVIFENFLNECNIPYQCKFRIYNETKTNFWFKEYDFLLLNTNILIEVDGDYWHGNEVIFSELSEFQKQVRKKDIEKENFAKLKGYEIIRFWGSEIINNSNDVKNKIIEIWEKLK
jgi:very-short-patch-repair endonuclease